VHLVGYLKRKLIGMSC